jgi:hypothetical protein
MGTDLAPDFAAILQAIRAWPASQRLSLAIQVLQSLADGERSDAPRGVPAAAVRGICATDRPPPTDEEVKAWIEEYHMRHAQR